MLIKKVKQSRCVGAFLIHTLQCGVVSLGRLLSPLDSCLASRLRLIKLGDKMSRGTHQHAVTEMVRQFALDRIRDRAAGRFPRCFVAPDTARIQFRSERCHYCPPLVSRTETLTCPVHYPMRHARCIGREIIQPGVAQLGVAGARPGQCSGGLRHIPTARRLLWAVLFTPYAPHDKCL